MSKLKKNFKGAADVKALSAVTDAPPPHSAENERCLLGCLLLGETDAMGRVIREGLQAEMFYRSEYGLVYGALQALFEEGEPVTEVTVLGRLEARGEAEQVGGLNAIFEIGKGVETTTALGYHLRLVIGLWKQRRMLRAAKQVAEIAGRPGDVFEAVRGEIQPPLTELGELSLSEQVVTARQQAIEFTQEKRAELAGQLERVPSSAQVFLGLPGIEEKFGVIDRRANDNLIVVAAPSSKGKSSLMRQVVNINLRKHSDWRVAYFVLEGSLRDYLHHSACAAGMLTNNISLDAWKQNAEAKTGEERAKAELALQKYFSELEFLEGILDDRLYVLEQDHDIGAIEGRCAELQSRTGRLDLIIVDYIQVIESTLKNVNREQQMSEVSGRLKRLQKRMGCPLFTGSQLNEEGKVRESRAIYNDATRFLKMERPEKDANGNAQKDGRAQYMQSIIQEKNRNGQTGWGSVNFNCAVGRFFDFGSIPAEKRGRPRKARPEQQNELNRSRTGMGDYF